MTDVQAVLTNIEPLIPHLEEVYRDLHRNPELSGHEERTAGIAAAALHGLGYEVTEGVGGHGVVGILRNGEGSTVYVRADMDALPVLEDTGLDYASTAKGIDPDGNTVPVAHACGHDMHVTCLLGALNVLAQTKDQWTGTVVAIFQPSEETMGGARSMIADGLFDIAPKPDIVLGQHVGPLPAGTIFSMPGSTLAAVDSMEIKLFGKGGHGSRPETTIDPIVMAAALILRLQTIASREIGPFESVVVTVGSIIAGTKHNIISDEALLKLTIRTFKVEVRDLIIAAIERMAKAEALASGSDREPEIKIIESAPTTDNDPTATLRVKEAMRDVLGVMKVWDMPSAPSGSEDFGEYGRAAGVPSVFWFFGGADPEPFYTTTDFMTLLSSLPSNHAPEYAPVIQPTLTTGIEALVIAALSWLGTDAADD